MSHTITPERVPPHSMDAEESVLSALLMEDGAMSKVRPLLTPESFYAEKHRRVYAAMLAIVDRGEVIDPVTLREEMDARGDLALVGGRDYLGYLIDIVPTASNVAYWAKIVASHAERRQLLQTLRDAQAAVWANDTPLADVAGQVQAALSSAVTEQGARGFRKVGTAEWLEYLEQLEERARTIKAGGSLGIPTGYPEIDQHTLGFRAGELIIPGARPKCGKTAFSLNVGINNVVDEREVGIVSTEMMRAEVLEGAMANLAQIERRRLSMGQLYDGEMGRMAKIAATLSGRLHIDDEAFPVLEDVVARALDLKARVPDLQLLIVDYLQRIGKRMKGRRGDEELAEVTKTMKGLAKQLGIPVIAPAQVNFKETDKREQKRPMLADIQGGSSFAQDANFVLILHRPGVFDPSPSLERVLEVDCQASRRTAPFTEVLEWDGPRMRITSPQQRARARTEQPR